MCVGSCLCNSCFKRKTCSDCKYIGKHKEVDCYNTGIAACNHYVIR